jgi:two-component system osmolarity sensor histidine kinase EnvZ
MTTFFRRPISLFRQIWFWFLLLITFNQAAILVSYYVLIVQPTASSLTTVFMGLADAVERQQSPTDVQGLGVLKDHWVSKDHIMVISGLPSGLSPKPPYPALQVIEDKIHAGWGERVKFGYSPLPERTLWLQFPNEEKPFSIGIPFSDRLQTQVLMLLVIGLIFMLTIIAAWVVSVRLGRPLNDLSTAARKMGRGEKVTMNLVAPLPPEVAGVAVALEQMQGEIEKMNAERERFLAGIAHDLRTPLSRMRVAVELSEVSDTKLAAGMQEDLEEMRIILDQFLELSRLDSEKSESFIEGDISDLMRDIGAKYERAKAPIQLLLGSTPFISYKPVALTRLIYNLIDNALRHGNGIVLLESGSDQAGVWMSVTSQGGIGIGDSALIQALRWVKGSQQSGLGTAIIRRVSEVHSADLSVETQNTGERRVTIRFKRAG